MQDYRYNYIRVYRIPFAGRYAAWFLGCIHFKSSAAGGHLVIFSAAQNDIGFYLAPVTRRPNASKGENLTYSTLQYTPLSFSTPRFRLATCVGFYFQRYCCTACATPWPGRRLKASIGYEASARQERRKSQQRRLMLRRDLGAYESRVNCRVNVYTTEVNVSRPEFFWKGPSQYGRGRS